MNNVVPFNQTASASQPQTYTFPMTGDAVRTIRGSDGEPWLVASDVARVLGFTHTPHMTRLLDPEDKGVQKVDTPGGPQSLTIINEGGVYGAVFSSRRPEAREFRRWVKHEVLPAIRKYGSYNAEPQLPDFSNPAEAARAWAEQYEQKQIAQRQAQEQQERAEAQATVLSKHNKKVHEVARQLPGVNSQAIKRDLDAAGYFYRSNGTNGVYRVYSKFRDSLFVEKHDKLHGTTAIYATGEGKEAITRLYREGRLTMKKNGTVDPTV